jgi:hypothetical protein
MSSTTGIAIQRRSSSLTGRRDPIMPRPEAGQSLGVPTSALAQYGDREHTRTDQLREIQA